MRPKLDSYFVKMLELVATRSTCPRRTVGAVITDKKGVVLATGYNGVPRGIPHCNEGSPCEGHKDPPGDTRRCMAVHAEQNALLQCADLERAHTIYVSAFPCYTCAKMIANTGIRRVVYLEDYTDSQGIVLFLHLGIEVSRATNGKN